jgi:hypothetical protein
MDELHVGDRVLYRGIIEKIIGGKINQYGTAKGHWFTSDEFELIPSGSTVEIVAPIQPAHPSAWRELDPPTPTKPSPDVWRSAVNDPPDTSCDVRVLSCARGIAYGHYYRIGDAWYEDGHHVVDILAWKELEPAEPAPAPAKIEYHKGQRIWLHHNGEVHPATFKRDYKCTVCKVKRDDGKSNSVRVGKSGWYTSLDFIEPMPESEDPRKETMTAKLLTAQEWLERLAKYYGSLPNELVQGTLVTLLFDEPEPREANYDIKDFYGTPDKAPDWLSTIATCPNPNDPAVLRECVVEARHWLAQELEKFEEEK